MRYYRCLNLPENPLKDSKGLMEKILLRKISPDPYSIESKEILTDEVLALLSKVNIDIDFIVVFKTYNRLGDQNHRIIHSDLTWHNDDFKNVSFGINWEVGQDKSATWQWWDMSKLESVYPPKKQPVGVFSKLSGIHYKERMHLGVPTGSILLEEASVSGPVLVCTDVPHSVLYSGSKRMSVSIRFKQLVDWNSAVDLFENLIID